MDNYMKKTIKSNLKITYCVYKAIRGENIKILVL